MNYRPDVRDFDLKDEGNFEFLRENSPKDTASGLIAKIESLSEDFKDIYLSDPAAILDPSTEEHTKAIELSKKATHAIGVLCQAIRLRRDKLRNDGTLAGSPFAAALDGIVGEYLDDCSATQINAFNSLQSDCGELPFPGSGNLKDLKLKTALDKWIHRDSDSLKFSINVGDPLRPHALYFFSKGNGHFKDSISAVKITDFCSVCRSAVNAW